MRNYRLDFTRQTFYSNHNLLKTRHRKLHQSNRPERQNMAVALKCNITTTYHGLEKSAAAEGTHEVDTKQEETPIVDLKTYGSRQYISHG